MRGKVANEEEVEKAVMSGRLTDLKGFIKFILPKKRNARGEAITVLCCLSRLVVKIPAKIEKKIMDNIWLLLNAVKIFLGIILIKVLPKLYLASLNPSTGSIKPSSVPTPGSIQFTINKPVTIVNILVDK